MLKFRFLTFFIPEICFLELLKVSEIQTYVNFFHQFMGQKGKSRMYLTEFNFTINQREKNEKRVKDLAKI